MSTSLLGRLLQIPDLGDVRVYDCKGIVKSAIVVKPTGNYQIGQEIQFLHDEGEPFINFNGRQVPAEVIAEDVSYFLDPAIASRWNILTVADRLILGQHVFWDAFVGPIGKNTTVEVVVGNFDSATSYYHIIWRVFTKSNTPSEEPYQKALLGFHARNGTIIPVIVGKSSTGQDEVIRFFPASPIYFGFA
jgi:hypothetical protein